MAKYVVHLRSTASTAITFETDLTDPHAIVDAFRDTDPDLPTLCHQCSGSRYGQNLDLSDEWDSALSQGTPIVTKIEN